MRHIFTERLTLLGGFGADVNLDIINVTFENTTAKHSISLFNFGFDGEARLKFDITNFIFVSVGVAASYTFATYKYVEESSINDSSSWMLRSIVGLAPFISIGVNSFSYGHFGKLNKATE